MIFPTGCKSTNINVPPPSRQTFKQVDFDKWVSGMYADEYAGQWVVVEGCYQASLFGQASQGAAEIVFTVLKKAQAETVREMRDAAMSGRVVTPGQTAFVEIRAPVSMRDAVFALKPDQPIRVYGRCQSLRTFTRMTPQGGGIHSLAVQAQSIEPR
jgi:hypothetical protein